MYRGWMGVWVGSLLLASQAWADTGCAIFADSFEGTSANLQCVAPSGMAFKGPFLTGGTVTITVLDATLQPTSQTLTTSIADDEGTFSIPTALAGKTVDITVNGRFYDEITNQDTSETITLKAITRPAAGGTAHISALTTIAIPRIEALVAQGKNVDQAIDQASTEVLDAIFQVSLTSSNVSDLGPGGAHFDYLLAFSALLMTNSDGPVDLSELSQLLDLLAADLTDGVLGNAEGPVNLKAGLVTLASQVNAEAVQTQLSDFYQQIGSEIIVPSIEGALNDIQSVERVEVTIGHVGAGTTNPTGSQSISAGSDLELSLIPDEGYFVSAVISSCGGQFTDNRTRYVISQITEACEVSVVFEPGGVTLTFDSNGGSALPAITLLPGSAIQAPTNPSKAGHRFVAWQPPLPTEMPDQDLTVTAQWAIKDITVTFDTDGGTVITAITAPFGEPLPTPSPPTKVGHSFAGWDPQLPATMPAGDATFTAMWTPNQYTLSFDSNGGSAIEPMSVSFGSPLSDLPTPEKTGHSFLRWQNLPDGDVMPANDLTLTAEWNVNRYTLTFKNFDDSDIEILTQDFGTTVNAPSVPNREGYTFDGWSPALPQTMPAQNLTLEANWTADAVSLTFDTDGGTSLPAIETVTDALIDPPEDPRRSGYQFAGWDPSLGGTAPPADQTYTALWNPEIFALNLLLDDGTAARQLLAGTFGSPVSAVNVPTRVGHIFLGYFTKPDGQGEQWFDQSGDPTDVNNDDRIWTTPNDVSLYAHWVPRETLIVFDQVATPVSFPLTGITASFGTSLPDLPDPERDGFQFLGWTPKLPDTMPAEDLVVTPTWAVNQYTLTLMLSRFDDTVYDTETVAFGETVPPISNPTRIGHSFDRWGPELPGTMWAKNSTHFAEWTANTYTITFDPAGGTGGPASQRVTFGQSPSEVINDLPTRTGGYDFAGYWTEENGAGERYFDQGGGPLRPWDIAADTTLYAHWTQGTFTLSFDSQGGTSIPPQYLTAEATPAEPTPPVRLGHTFTGWSPDIPSKMPSNNVQVTAQWQADGYTIRLIDPGASSIPEVAVTFGETVPDITPPTREGYTFLGYFEGRFGASSQFYDASGNGLRQWLAIEDRYLYGDWSRNDYTLSFDLGYTPSDSAITPPSDITQGFGTAIVPPPSPTRVGYTFTGWYPAIPETVPAANQTHTAQWSKNDYTLVFDTEGGSAIADSVIGFDEAVNAPTDPTRTGFTFSGWVPTLPATMPANDLQVVAEWTPNSHTITLNPQGGNTTEGSVTATYGALLPEASAPTKAFATFAGYWTEPNGGGQQYYDPRMVPTQTWLIDADATLHAHWIEDIRFTINLVAIPASGGNVSGTGTYSEGQTVSASATANEGYVFVGFYEADSVAAKVNPYNFPAKRDRNLVARFTQPPTAPVIRVTPRLPSANFDLVCEIHQASVDPDGDPIAYEFIWTRQADANSPPEITEFTGQAVPASAVNEDEIWSCEAYADDGWVLSEASSCENLDPTQSGAPWVPAEDCGREITVADYCSGSPCQNGGACSEDANRGTFVCDCSSLPNWSGDRCDVIDACALATAAGDRPCGEFGQCINDGFGGYDCLCTEQGIGCACCDGLVLEGFTCTLQGLRDTGDWCVSGDMIEEKFGPFN